MRSVYPGRISPSCLAVLAVFTLFALWRILTGRPDRSAEFAQSLEQRYDARRELLLRSKGFDAQKAARHLRAPESLPFGQDSLDPSVDTYVTRLEDFVQHYIPRSMLVPELNRTIEEIKSRSHFSLTSEPLPRRVWSTNKAGIEGVDQYFNLWKDLLPLPLSEPLLAHLEGLSPRQVQTATNGTEWDVKVADDDDIDMHITAWSGESSVRQRSEASTGLWGSFWSSLPFGVLRSDVFRYFALLATGGIYADSDTAPLVHPYLWGIDSDSILDPQLEVFLNLNAGLYEDGKGRPVYVPPYPGARKAHGRGQVHADANAKNQIPGAVSSILSDVSMVVSLEWDSSIAFSPSKWFQWRWWRFERSLNGCCYARSLQVVQNLIMAKPHHPVLLDTLATITELVQAGQMDKLGALDLTGPGPFTDAVLRYLLVRYGVTPDELRSLPQSVRIGDIIILREESFLASDYAFKTFVQRLSDPEGVVTDVWSWGTGFWSWASGGKVVARHGLQGSWKDQRW